MKYKIGDVISNGKVFFRFDVAEYFGATGMKWSIISCTEKGVTDKFRYSIEGLSVLRNSYLFKDLPKKYQFGIYKLYSANLTRRNRKEIMEVKEYFTELFEK